MKEKVEMWYSTSEWIIENPKIEKKGYLVTGNGQRKFTPEVTCSAFTLFFYAKLNG